MVAPACAREVRPPHWGESGCGGLSSRGGWHQGCSAAGSTAARGQGSRVLDICRRHARSGDTLEPDAAVRNPNRSRSYKFQPRGLAAHALSRGRAGRAGGASVRPTRRHAITGSQVAMPTSAGRVAGCRDRRERPSDHAVFRSCASTGSEKATSTQPPCTGMPARSCCSMKTRRWPANSGASGTASFRVWRPRWRPRRDAAVPWRTTSPNGVSSVAVHRRSTAS